MCVAQIVLAIVARNIWCSAVALTNNELDFIINYDINYRMGGCGVKGHGQEVDSTVRQNACFLSFRILP